MDTILFIVTANCFDVNKVHLYYGLAQPVLNRLTTLEAQTKPFALCSYFIANLSVKHVEKTNRYTVSMYEPKLITVILTINSKNKE